MTLTSLILRYVAFSAIATVANLGAQRFVLSMSGSTTGFAAALVAGTLVGLVVKYHLDRKWIFYDTASGARIFARRFSIYSAMGVVTTLLFWAAETAFWLIWQTEIMRELGAVIGLAAGYAIKYQLDRRFVFT